MKAHREEKSGEEKLAWSWPVSLLLFIISIADREPSLPLLWCFPHAGQASYFSVYFLVSV